MFCQNCGTEFEGGFCPNCGTPAQATIPQQPSAPNYQQPVDLGSQQQPVSDYQQPIAPDSQQQPIPDYQQPFAPGFQQQPPVPPKTKKKFPIWLLIILIVAGVLIVVCSAGGILVAVNSNNSGGTSQSNSEAPSGTTVSNDFDSGTTEFSMDTFAMQIPSAWYKEKSDDDTSYSTYYFYPLLDSSRSFLMVQYHTEDVLDISNDRAVEFFLEAFTEKYSDLELQSNQLLENNSFGDYRRIAMDFSVNGTLASTDMVLFNPTEDSIVVMAMVADSEANVDYSNDYQKIIDSIQLVDEPANSGSSQQTSGSSSGSGMTASQKDALDKADSYLSWTNFSRQGLIDQLEYEGFSQADSEYAVDNCGADWNEQALGKAKSYLKSSAFSYSGLIDQLEYEDFTTEQATYAVDNCGADWNEQAIKCAERYIKYTDLSGEKLVSQLEYEGFTYEQAVYGAQRSGGY